ncbi:MAG: U32 family peptidase [Oscillospiraceae bacterium]|nr:U32 family peptidase [Oscillospiraceae bacterium]
MIKLPKKPEILSPAGNFEKLRTAVYFGADAVYFAGKNFGMRAGADNFTLEEIEQACLYTRNKNKKAYLTVNTVPKSRDIAELTDYLKQINAMTYKPSAIICADIGVVMLIKKILPDVDIHISTQANTQSWTACEAWAELGVKRIILSRELNFEDIHEIRDNLNAEIELECFIHGAMCVSYSGRCLISNYLTSRDANRGACTQPCRWKYYLTEEKRPDIFLEITERFDKGCTDSDSEGEPGTFLFSSKDLCMIEHIPDLVNSGIGSFKIEGRMKSAYYTACITNAYRIALDNFYENGAADPDLVQKLKLETESVSRREYDTGYFYTTPASDAKICGNPDYIREKTYLGICMGYEQKTGLAVFEQRNKIVQGQKVQILSPGGVGRGILADVLLDENDEPICSAPHPFQRFKLRVNFKIDKGDILRSDEQI